MTHADVQNIYKYQSSVPSRILQAVQKASAKTGVDFSFLMAKASTESGFNPSAKAKTSSATGLFQFIDSTWLNMVKQYGAKYGLGKLADQIEIKDGKPCVTDCAVKNQILNLRKNPEICAYMAGEFSADNKEFLEKNTQGDVGSTELYLAHFLGANSAAKFLNCRDCDGSAKAAELFPAAAKANKGVFFDKQTGRARSLDDIYNLFANKFQSAGGVSPSTSATPQPPSIADNNSPAAPAPTAPLKPLNTRSTESMLDVSTHVGQALPSFDDGDDSDDIIWNNDPRFKSGWMHTRNNIISTQKLSPISIMIAAEMQQTLSETKRNFSFNS